MKRYYCTYLDRNYLAKGLALIESLKCHEPGFSLYVICLDEISRLILKKLEIPGVVPMPLHDFECNDETLLSVKPQRSLVEYYWTLTPTLILRLLERNPGIDVLTYLDADLFFFSSPDPIFKEMESHSVLIHEHRFSPALAHLERENGKFNVGLLCFRNDATGKSVLSSWRMQCIEWCFNRYEDGKMGDQMYLNGWPGRFCNVRVLGHAGGGVAPWNNDQYRFSVSRSGNSLANGSDLIFYHFQSLGLADPETLVLAKHLTYRLSQDVIKHCYLPYADALSRAITLIRSIQPDFDFGLYEKGVLSDRHVFFKKTGAIALDSRNPLIHRLRKLSASWDCFLSSQATDASQAGVHDEESQLWTEGRAVRSEDDLLLTLKDRSICQTIRVLYMVGAHEFQEEKLLHELFPNLEQIYLFEPIPEVFNELVQKLLGRPGLEVLPVALSERNGTANFFVTNNRASSSLLTLGEHKRIFPHVSVHKVIKVNCRTLDSVISERKLLPPDMLFLDVQGAEYQILSSISPDLLKQIHLIYTEASKEEVYQGARNLDELKTILSREFAFLGFAPLTDACPTHGNALFVNRKHVPGLRYDSSIEAPGHDQSVQSLLLAGFSHLERNHWEAALTTFGRALELEPRRQGLYFLRGRCLLELNRLKEAAQALELELNIQPNHPDAQRLLGEVKRRVASLSPGVYSRQQALSLCEQASQLWLAGETGEALALLDQALHMESSLLGAHYAHALCLQQMGRIAEAESAVRKEILLQPDHREARKLFHALRKRQPSPKTPSRSIPCLPEWIASTVQDALPVPDEITQTQTAQANRMPASYLQDQALESCHQGTALLEAFRYSQALEKFNEALKIEERVAGAQYARALCLEKIGRCAEAAEALRTELRLQPNHAEARKLLRELRATKQQPKRSTSLISAGSRMNNSEPLLSRNPGVMHGKAALPQGVFKESQLAHQLLDGLKGLEIGPSSHNPFGLNTRNVGQRDEIYEQEQLRLMGKVTFLDFVARADEIPVESESEDFVLSSHVVGHCPNLVKTLLEWFRIVKPGGYIYMIVPHRDAAPSDVGRPLTDWKHLLDDYRANRTPETEPEAGKFLHCHYHVFVTETMKQFMQNIFGERVMLVASQDIDDKVGNGFALVYRKAASLSSSYPWTVGSHPNPVVVPRLLRPEEGGHRLTQGSGITPISDPGSEFIKLNEPKDHHFGAPEASAQQLALQGFQRFEKQEWGSALGCFEQALEAEPQKQGIHFLRAQCFFRLGQWKDAERAVFAELKIQPNHPDTRGLLRELRQQQKVTV